MARQVRSRGQRAAVTTEMPRDLLEGREIAAAGPNRIRISWLVRPGPALSPLDDAEPKRAC